MTLHTIRGLAFTTLALAWCTLLACAEPAPSSPGVRRLPDTDPRRIAASNAYGLNVGTLSNAAGASTASYMVAANIGWVRSAISWAHVAEQWMWYNPHNCDPNVGAIRDTSLWNWSGPDSLYNRAQSEGLNVYFTLFDAPCPESQKRDSSAAVAVKANGDTVGWKLFVQAAVNRYPNVRHWGIYNEVNDLGHYSGAPGMSRTAAYVQLVNTAAPIIHAAGDSLVALDLVNGGNDGISDSTWITNVFGSAGSNIDVLSVHFYHVSGAIAAINKFAQWAAAASPGSTGSSNVWVGEAGFPADAPSEEEVAINAASFVNYFRTGGATAWKKTFYWNGHTTTSSPDTRNIFTSDGVNSVTPRMGYYAYKCAIIGSCSGPTVSIVGTTSIAPYASCEWYASVSGTGPFLYSWNVNNEPAGSDASVWFTNTGSNFLLSVTVIDAIGRSAYAEQTISVSSGNYCL